MEAAQIWVHMSEKHLFFRHANEGSRIYCSAPYVTATTNLSVPSIGIAPECLVGVLEHNGFDDVPNLDFCNRPTDHFE